VLKEHTTADDWRPARIGQCRDCVSVLAGARLSHPYLVLAKRASPIGDNTYHCLICRSVLLNNPNHLGCGWALTLVKG
jgi:hypothetical protein